MWLLLQCFFRWRIPPSEVERLRTADVVLGQSFGLRGQRDPGESNRALAEVTAQLYYTYGIPAVLQWEIADAMPRDVPLAGRIEAHRVQGQYLDTLEVLRQAKEICGQYGWKRAVIIAHPDHLWRVMRTARKLGFVTIVPNIDHVPYDSQSEQWWTRSWWLWFPREIAVRLMCLVRGWI